LAAIAQYDQIYNSKSIEEYESMLYMLRNKKLIFHTWTFPEALSLYWTPTTVPDLSTIIIIIMN